MSAVAKLKTDAAVVQLHDRLNAGTPLDLARVRAVRVNQPAVARRVATLNASRSVKKVYQAAWLVRAIQCMDLTTLSGDDTPGRVDPHKNPYHWEGEAEEKAAYQCAGESEPQIAPETEPRLAPSD